LLQRGRFELAGIPGSAGVRHRNSPVTGLAS
jgi:hypothetical protein